MKPPIERFRKKYRINSDNCHEWFGACTLQSRPMFTVTEGKSVPAQRFIFEQTHGPIAPNHEILAVCGCKVCVNVEHLRSVSVTEHRAARSAKLTRVKSPQVQRARRVLTWLQVKFPMLEADIENLKMKINSPEQSTLSVWERIQASRTSVMMATGYVPYGHHTHAVSGA